MRNITVCLPSVGTTMLKHATCGAADWCCHAGGRQAVRRENRHDDS